ncbi:unnamed protein product [Lasius platythorax]|uniref:Uncharacterized protein n=1 Tax=Lasius platythorax TaxID=488582 RepID=A0AAV2P434_9HYME
MAGSLGYPQEKYQRVPVAQRDLYTNKYLVAFNRNYPHCRGTITTGLLTPGTDVALLLELSASCFYYEQPEPRIYFPHRRIDCKVTASVAF